MTAIKRVPDVLHVVQAAARPRRRRDALPRRRRPRPRSASSSRRTSSASRGTCSSSATSATCRPYYALFDALAAALGERGDAGRRDRGARRAAARRRDARRRRARRRPRRRGRLPRRGRRHRRRSPTRSRRSRATRSCDARMGESGRERVLPRYRVERLVDDVDALYRELLSRAGFAAAAIFMKAANGGFFLPLPSAARTASPRRRRLVLEQEPEHHVDARVLARDRERLRQVERLLRPRDAEERVGRVRLVAVLGDPDPLVAVELRDQRDQVADVAERDRGRRCALRRDGLRRRLCRSARRSTGGAPRRRTSSGRPSCTARRNASGETDGRALVGLLLPRGAVTPQATRSLGDERRVDAAVDRVADLRVVDRALDRPARRRLLVLRREEDRVVRLVPGEPLAHRRQHAPVGARVGAAVARGGRVGEVAQVGRARRRDVRRPCRRSPRPACRRSRRGRARRPAPRS